MSDSAKTYVIFYVDPEEGTTSCEKVECDIRKHMLNIAMNYYEEDEEWATNGVNESLGLDGEDRISFETSTLEELFKKCRFIGNGDIGSQTVGVIEIDFQKNTVIMYDLTTDEECQRIDISDGEGLHVFFKIDRENEASFEIVEEADAINHLRNVLDDRIDPDASDSEDDSEESEDEDLATVDGLLRAINVASVIHGEICGTLFASNCAISNGAVTINHIKIF